LANAREIKLRIKGVNETKKITKAMKLISASKLKKAKMMHEATMPFFMRVQDIMTHILAHLPDIESVYFEKREKADNLCFFRHNNKLCSLLFGICFSNS
jgi:F-type H+-transporting ATPase subunit gamma